MIIEREQPEIREPIGVLGYGEEGRSTCRYLLGRGFADITVFDRNPPLELAEGRLPGLRLGGKGGSESYLEGLSGMRTLFRSAGVRPDFPEISACLEKGGTLTSQTGLAFALAGRRRIIGVTGTLGKGTACSLLLAMLSEAGIKARLGGNIGIPALDLAASLEPGEFLILELSSFQLSALAQSPAMAVVLRTTSEHLDWHASREEYLLHKANLVVRQRPEDLLIHFADAQGSAWIAERSAARKIAFGSGAEVRIGPAPGALFGGVSGIMPGSHAFVPVDLPAGQYALICFVPDAKDGKPHFAHGMAKLIKVT